MNTFTRLRYAHLLHTGFSRDRFDERLRQLARAAFRQQELSPNEQRVWSDPAVQDYQANHIAHLWRAIGSRGVGAHNLGFLKRAEALKTVGTTLPKSVIINVDDLNHFIFYKVGE